jgi:hypothetical protein
MTTSIVGVVALVVLVAVIVAAFPLVKWIAGRRRSSETRSLPPLFFPMSPNGTRDSLEMEAHWAKKPPTPPAPAPAVNPFAPPPPTATPRPPRRAAVYDDIDEDKPAPAETVRFIRRVDEPVQLLPGRLEVLAGDTRLHEIRFVRIPGKADHLILGRDAGPSPQYVGLGSTTVSRRHARFAYVGGSWTVENLSKTNPVVVNDDELSDIDGERPLVDGDRLELGEVVLRFRAH